MAGHSKWHSIRHKKGANDAKRGKIFTKHARLITLAAKNGDDPDLNALLRAAIDNAKAANVPNDNIQRAIDKASGANNDTQMFEMTYEAYGPNGVAFLIDAITDNKNRTITSVRTILNKNGGSLGESGSVSYMFKLRGVIVGQGEINDELSLEILDLGAEDIEQSDDGFVVTTDPSSMLNVRSAIESANVTIDSAEVAKVADTEIEISDKTIEEKILKLISKLEEDDDITDVYTNCNV